MNFRELDELVEWMRERGVIHMAYEGVTLTLAEVAPIVYASLEEEKASPSEEEDGFETPQQRIRAQLHKNRAERDNANVVE
jgi:hypothetical protein